MSAGFARTCASCRTSGRLHGQWLGTFEPKHQSFIGFAAAISFFPNETPSQILCRCVQRTTLFHLQSELGSNLWGFGPPPGILNSLQTKLVHGLSPGW